MSIRNHSLHKPKRLKFFSSDVTPIDVGGLPSDIRTSGDWAIVDGFNKMKYDLVFADHGIEARTVQSVVFDMVVAGDYNIAVIGFSDANRAAEGADPFAEEWIKNRRWSYRNAIS